MMTDEQKAVEEMEREIRVGIAKLNIPDYEKDKFIRSRDFSPAAAALDKAGYRKQRETVKEFAEKLLSPLINAYNQSYTASGYDMEAARSASEIKHYIDHIKQTAELFGKEE